MTDENDKVASDVICLDVSEELYSDHSRNGESQPDGIVSEMMVEPPSKKLRTTEELDMRFLVSSKEAGAIIGKGGANINHLRKHYKCSVTVPDCPGPERVLSVVTTLDALGEILTETITYIDDRPQKQGEREVELRLLIHTSHAGGIIGRGGQRIRDLRDQTKAAIKVFSQCCPMSTERVCAIQGTPEIVIESIKTILDIILATPIKGAVKLYDPYHADVYMAPEYGGFTETVAPGFRNSGRGPAGNNRRGDVPMGLPSRPQWDREALSAHAPPHPQPHPHQPTPEGWARMAYEAPQGVDRRGPALPTPQMYSRWLADEASRHRLPLPVTGTASDATPYWSDVIPSPDSNTAPPLPPPPPPPMHGWSDPYEAKTSLFEPSDLIENPDGSAAATLTVPNSVAGAIIGKGGNRIRLVRRDSGADISIDNAAGPGNDRIVLIKGSEQQVRVAYDMLQRSITENTARY